MSKVFSCNVPEMKTDDGKVVSDTAAKFVLLALADHASDDGEHAYAGVRRLCQKTNLSTSTVCNALNAMRNNRFLRWDGKSKVHTNNYTILVAEIERFQWPKQADSSGRNREIPVAETESLVKPSLKPLDKILAPKANQIPEVVLFREVTHRYPPSVNFGDVVDCIGGVSARLGRKVVVGDLLPYYREWCRKGYKPVNLAWLEWAVTGQIPKNGRSNHDQNLQNVRAFLERTNG
jgi:hypothetical protein